MTCVCWLLVGTHFEKYLMGRIVLKVDIETDLQDSDIHHFIAFLWSLNALKSWLFVCAPANHAADVGGWCQCVSLRKICTRGPFFVQTRSKSRRLCREITLGPDNPRIQVLSGSVSAEMATERGRPRKLEPCRYHNLDHFWGLVEVRTTKSYLRFWEYRRLPQTIHFIRIPS